MAQQFELRCVLPVPSVDGIEVATRTSRTGRALDIYRPAGIGKDPLPAVVFVPGDGPEEVIANAKDWGQYVSWGQLVASRGLIAVTINHRSTSQYSDLEGAAADVDAALDWVRADGHELGIDPERIGIWTCSAGGPLALRTVLRDQPRFVRALAALYAVLDLGGERRAFSPAHQLESGSGFPPMLVVRAGKDAAAINRSIETFVAAAIAAGVDIEYLNHAGGRHGFDVLDDTARSRAIIRRTLDFLSEALES